MKKILTSLTGIMFLVTILVTGCRSGSNPDDTSGVRNDTLKAESDTTKTGIDSTQAENDSTRVEIYMKAVKQHGRMHLEMYNGKHPEETVIDSLFTEVYPGYTVVWKKVGQSGIKKVNHIRPMEDKGRIFSDEAREVEGLFQLKIPWDASPDTVKYEVVFTVEDDDIWCIDPYLRIPHY